MSRNTLVLYIFINNSLAIDSFETIQGLYVRIYDVSYNFPLSSNYFSENTVFFMRFNAPYFR